MSNSISKTPKSTTPEPGYRYLRRPLHIVCSCGEPVTGELVWLSDNNLFCVACQSGLRHPHSVSDTVAAAMTGLAVRAAEGAK